MGIVGLAARSDDFIDATGSQDIWVDGIARVELLENMVRVIYYKWAISGGLWRKVPLDFAVVRRSDDFFWGGPTAATPFPIIAKKTSCGMH